ncbi:molybdenum cofactor guanylyltransferase [Achromobacter sp. SS2-2022]|nr:molybdenum cofactor guanylyltransferase MobA [Achromobacter sp. SS2-2022]WEX97317.1 molybdenum cofactor guanylyltransferase [Achromobacter sp. SS2-2022]
MGHQDKGLVLLHGAPMVAHVARRLAPQVGRLIISANRHAERYAQYGTVVADGEPALGEFQGPLVGLAAGLATASAAASASASTATSTADVDWVVAVPCDTPFLPHDLATRLIAAADSAQAPLAYAMAGGQRHAACMALRPSLLPDLRAYLLAGERKVGLWQARVGGVAASFDDAPDAFMNVNTPEELAVAERCAGFAS